MSEQEALDAKHELAMITKLKPIQDGLAEIRNDIQHQTEIMSLSLEQQGATLELLQDIVLGESGDGGLRKDVRDLQDDVKYMKSGSHCPHKEFIAEAKKNRKTMMKIGGIILIVLAKDLYILGKAAVPFVLKLLTEVK